MINRRIQIGEKWKTLENLLFFRTGTNPEWEDKNCNGAI